MSAFLFIQKKRKALDNIDQLSLLRLSQARGKDAKKVIEQQMEKWAREADVQIMFEN